MTPAVDTPRGYRRERSGLYLPGQGGSIVEPAQASVMLAQRRRGFRPSDLAGLVLWTSARYPETLWTTTARSAHPAGGDPVGAWDDLSGNAKHLEQATTGARFTYSSSDPSVSSDGVDDMLASASSVTVGAFTLFLVAKITSSTGFVWSLYESAGALELSYAYKPSGWTLRHSRGNNASVNGGTWPGTSTVAQHCWVCSRASSPYAEWYVDGASQVQQTAAPGSATTTGTFSIGDYASGGGGPTGAEYREVILYDSALSDSDRQRVEGYLRRTWGTA